ncbi:FAD-linked oxidoreductase DDB_G0289697-like [Actinia tenebrosa]|uniref:FAD-linked oxidoreductase DDB_G0289697-like n=1 Tax=Actinia tenebrosa TaxID=6105 RepID=A0A6P8IKQ8_ACTTE|nr:FAD-linked oxidoreductase DDB_G0289697-like [Actinia tenebrosa]
MADFSFLKKSIQGKIVEPSDGKKYDNEIKKVWNACLYDKRPLAFVKVKGKDDVAKTVKFCVRKQLDLCVSCGGTSDFVIADDAVIIDLSMMKRIKIDKTKKTAKVEGGVIVSDVDEALQERGFILPLGSFSKLGVAGMTLMGGLGFTTRSYGITSDNVLEYELVTANGNVIKVSDKDNENLFWGMKGSGFNFGVVTSIAFQVFEMPSLIVGGIMYYQISRAKEVIHAFRRYYAELNDNKLCLYMLLHMKPTGPELLIRLHYNGALRKGGEIVQDLQDLTRPYKNTCHPIPHCEFQKQGDLLLPRGRFQQGSVGHFLPELKDEVVDNLIDGIHKVPGDFNSYTDTIIYITTTGGKANEVELETSSFPFRGNACYWIGMNGTTNDANNMDALEQWVSSVQDINAPYGIAPYSGGDAEQALEKLKQLKQQYDPENLFHNNCMNINPE